MRPIPCPPSQGISSQSASVSSVGRITLSFASPCPGQKIGAADLGQIVTLCRHLAQAVVPFVDDAIAYDAHRIELRPLGTKIEERTVCSPLAATMRRLCSGWTADSRVATIREPTHTPSAPSAKAAAAPRPSAMPPPANTSEGATAQRPSAPDHGRQTAIIVPPAPSPGRRPPRFRRRARSWPHRLSDLLPDRHAGIAKKLYMLCRRVSPMKGYSRHALFCADANLRVVVEDRNEIDVEGRRGLLVYFLDHDAELLRGRKAYPIAPMPPPRHTASARCGIMPATPCPHKQTGAYSQNAR